MLRWRLLISAILIPGFAVLFVVDHRSGPAAWYLLALCAILAIRSTYEMVALLRSRALTPNAYLVGLCSVAVIAAGWFGNHTSLALSTGENTFASLGPIALAYTLCVLLLLLKGAIVFREPGRSVETLGSELLIVSYVGLLLAMTAQLRWVAGPQAGYLVLGSLLIVVKCGDVGAYTLGRLFGKRKMVPRLSPGKTWMGALGALLSAGAASVLWLHFVTPLFDASWQPCAWHWALIYGVGIGLAGLLGDLCESMIKRDVGQKDASSLMPGFGGALDILDSVVFAGPIAYVLWQVLPLATWR